MLSTPLAAFICNAEKSQTCPVPLVGKSGAGPKAEYSRLMMVVFVKGSAPTDSRVWPCRHSELQIAMGVRVRMAGGLHKERRIAPSGARVFPQWPAWLADTGGTASPFANPINTSENGSGGIFLRRHPPAVGEKWNRVSYFRMLFRTA